ncbi:MAG: ABC transporter permease [Nitrospinae bacterium]|nr:ABC transporter permease [Nitrospinota bacterium]
MVNLPAIVKISLRALLVNRMRSALTMLGMIIGVAAVITMMAVGTGAGDRIAAQMASMGSNLLMVFSGAATTGGSRMGAGTMPTLTMRDTEAIRKECPAVEDAAPIVNGTLQVVYGNQNWSTIVIGTTPNMLEIREWPVSEGRPFQWEDVRSATKVCLLGQTLVDNLFLGADPLGQTVRIKNVPFTVIGILKKKGQNPTGQDQDDTIYVPITTGQKRLFGAQLFDMVRIIFVKAKSFDDLDSAETQITELLRQRHHIGPRQDDDFNVRNLTQIMQSAQSAVNTVTTLLSAIASVSLLVGGIGIMNIMLVSVTERTKEIGVRMAVGAKSVDIRFQFLIEALLLSLIGGALGIVLGIAGAQVFASVVGAPVIITLSSILLAFGFSAAVGVFFGYYPAYKASQLDPIEALRYE